jgi:hypothetical protein
VFSLSIFIGVVRVENKFSFRNASSRLLAQGILTYTTDPPHLGQCGSWSYTPADDNVGVCHILVTDPGVFRAANEGRSLESLREATGKFAGTRMEERAVQVVRTLQKKTYQYRLDGSRQHANRCNDVRSSNWPLLSGGIVNLFPADSQ